jgi:hypothetical protein
MAQFKIYAALNEDVNQGWVWLQKSQLPLGSPQRSIVKLSASATSKHTYCETRLIDKNFINRYNESSHTKNIDESDLILVAAEWYQIHLGIENDDEAEIKVTSANHFCGRIYACLDHPQVVVRVATILGLVAVALGLIPIIPFFISFARCILNLVLGGCNTINSSP